MLYRSVKKFVKYDATLQNHSEEIVREMACEIIKMMSEEDFKKIFTVQFGESNWSYFSEVEIEVKLIK